MICRISSPTPEPSPATPALFHENVSIPEEPPVPQITLGRSSTEAFKATMEDCRMEVRVSGVRSEARRWMRTYGVVMAYCQILMFSLICSCLFLYMYYLCEIVRLCGRYPSHVGQHSVTAQSMKMLKAPFTGLSSRLLHGCFSSSQNRVCIGLVTYNYGVTRR